MALLKKLPSAQTVLAAVFEFNYNDTMKDTTGATKTLGDVLAGVSFDVFTPPPGAIVIGGNVKVLTAFNSTANSVDIGDSDDTNRYTETAAVNLQDPDGAATAFDMLGDHKIYGGSQTVRMLLTNTVAAATAGRAVITVLFVMPGRASENIKTT